MFSEVMKTVQGPSDEFNGVSPTRYSDVLIPSVSECNPIWKFLHRVSNQVKRRSLGVALNTLRLVTYKQDIRTQIHTGRTPREDKDRDPGDASTSLGMPRTASYPQKLGERRGTDSPLGPPERNQPCQHQASRIQNWEGMHFCCVNFVGLEGSPRE